MAEELRVPLKEVHCESCERHINEALSRLPGVLQVQASSKTKDVTVKVQGTRTDEQAIRARLMEIGFEPKER
ncbi:MAG: heavy-metal-associated domain-containing protein [Chloroflexota bacterium]|nr:heavy-metal-associated domain-containing protein [Chloroflexota bacterium]